MRTDYYFTTQERAEQYAQADANRSGARVWVARGFDEARVAAFAVRHAEDDETFEYFDPLKDSY